MAPLASGTADISGLLWGYLYDARERTFWRKTTRTRDNYIDNIVCGTLAFTKSRLRRSTGYPDTSVGEEVRLLMELISQEARFTPVMSHGIYICIRHSSNSWHFDPNSTPSSGWRKSEPPPFIPREDIRFYDSVIQRQTTFSPRQPY
ncbi:hypothetical protein [Actinophytocola sp.]|uniref:hypothetical protein n=1 Tax=Actinophytocola sp. TaxID=1872138 RepID=UPI00389B3228